MAVKKIANTIRKTEQRIKANEITNPEMARRLKGKLALLKGEKK